MCFTGEHKATLPTTSEAKLFPLQIPAEEQRCCKVCLII